MRRLEVRGPSRLFRPDRHGAPRLWGEARARTTAKPAVLETAATAFALFGSALPGLALRGRLRPHPGFARSLAAAVLLLGGLLAGCGGDPAPPAATEWPSWSVTAWGEGYEVFPEAPALVAGEAAEVYTHVTVLDGFAPLDQGRVEVVLRPAEGTVGEAVTWGTAAERPGVFPVEVTPPSPGDYDLAFRLPGGEGRAPGEVAAGRVRVGTAGAPGRLLRAPAPRGALEPAEPVPFLKEQQWRADFATDWVRRGELVEELRGPARLRPPAGGEAFLTAPVDGVLRPAPWPHPGQRVGSGEPLFRLVPRVAAERSLAELDARLTALEVDLEAARARRGRLEELLALEAVSRRELEEATARVAGLEARLEAARRDLAAARDARAGGGGSETLSLAAPFAGRVGAVEASPGAAVDAGDSLARLVRTDPVWVEVHLLPGAAAELSRHGAAGLLLELPDGPPRRLPADRVRLVSVAPEVDPASGTVPVLLEVSAPEAPSVDPEPPALPLGTRLEAAVLLAGSRPGVVVPTSALVDDGGVTTVYLQLSGERFVRQEIDVVARQGDRALVEGLVPGQRLVTRGGDAIRRTSLTSGGAEAHGHVH